MYLVGGGVFNGGSPEGSLCSLGPGKGNPTSHLAWHLILHCYSTYFTLVNMPYPPLLYHVDQDNFSIPFNISNCLFPNCLSSK